MFNSKQARSLLLNIPKIWYQISPSSGVYDWKVLGVLREGYILLCSWIFYRHHLPAEKKKKGAGKQKETWEGHLNESVVPHIHGLDNQSPWRKSFQCCFL